MNKSSFAGSPININPLATQSTTPAGGTLYVKFTTRNTSGVPTTLGGSPAVSIYKDNSTTQSTAGVTLTAYFDGVVGLNHVTIDTSSDGSFYVNGSHYELVITTGTVGGTSVVGEDVGSFDLAASTSAPSAATISAAVWDELLTGATHNITSSAGKILRTIAPVSDAIYSGTLPSQSGMTSTQIKLDAGASSSDTVYNDDVISILTGTGAGESAIVTGYVGSTRVATVNRAWSIQPGSGATYELTPMTTVTVTGPVTVGTMNTGVITSGSFAAGAITSSSIAAGALNGKGDWLTATDSRLNNLDATISSRSTYAGGAVASVTAPVTLPTIPTSWITSAGIAAGALNGKGDWSTLTADQAADKLIGRNIEGGADGGRTVAEALAFLRNKWTISSGVLTVFAANDSNTMWTASVTTTSGNPVTAIDPA